MIKYFCFKLCKVTNFNVKYTLLSYNLKRSSSFETCKPFSRAFFTTIQFFLTSLIIKPKKMDCNFVIRELKTTLYAAHNTSLMYPSEKTIRMKRILTPLHIQPDNTTSLVLFYQAVCLLMSSGKGYLVN